MDRDIPPTLGGVVHWGVYYLRVAVTDLGGLRAAMKSLDFLVRLAGL